MSLTYDLWPFLGRVNSSNKEVVDQWWEQCYLPGAADSILSGQSHWRIVVGGMGSGKSVALSALERQVQHHSLILVYKSTSWPSSEHVLLREGNHLSQIMALASKALRDHLLDNPAKITCLSKTQCEYLHWLLQKFSPPRTYPLWLKRIPSSHAGYMRQVEYNDLYPSQTEYLDVSGQIDELVDLAQDLGWRQVMILIDVDPILSKGNFEDLLKLFDWLEMMHHRDLVLVAAIPMHLLERGNLLTRTRGRVNAIRLQWSQEETREMASCHIRTATRGALSNLTDLVSERLLAVLEELIEAEYGAPTPKGTVDLAQVLLEFATRHPIPMGIEMEERLKRAIYAECLVLRPDTSVRPHGVWRGPRFIPLEDQPLLFLQMLCKQRGQIVDNMTLHEVLGSKDNIHTLARRLRLMIEPDPSEPIYILSRRRAGYWLVRSQIDSTMSA